MKVLEVHEYELTDSQVNRLESNHICSVEVLDDINAPIIKKHDIVHFIMSDKINTRDFIIYRNYDKFFIRRILKITNKGVYVAGDKEKKYHLINKNDIMARAVGREHNTRYLSFTLKHRRRLYTFTKTRISYLRIKNRITDYDEEMNEITLKHLKANQNNTFKEEKIFYTQSKSFLNVFIKLDSKYLTTELLAILKKNIDFYKVRPSAITFIVDDTNNTLVKAIKNMGFLIASNNLFDIYRNNVKYFILDYLENKNIALDIINLCKDYNVDIILSNVNDKESLDFAKEKGFNYIFGNYYKRLNRMKDIIKKVE